MPDAVFADPSPWRWLIALYFFIGGLAGGCYFVAALIDLFGRPSDRPLARLGYRIAFPSVLVCGALLLLDLDHLERAGSLPRLTSPTPMSLGAWGLLVFGGFALLSFLATRGPDARRRVAARLRPPGALGASVAVLGAASGFFLASYTGVLLAVTNRPIWSDMTLLGLVFLISSASTSVALLLLLGSRRVFLIGGLRALQRFDVAGLLLELVSLAALIASLGSLARLWLDEWGGLLALGVVGLGIVVPLVLHWRAHTPTAVAAKAAAVLVLVGGFLLRVVIVLGSGSA